MRRTERGGWMMSSSARATSVPPTSNRLLEDARVRRLETPAEGCTLFESEPSDTVLISRCGDRPGHRNRKRLSVLEENLTDPGPLPAFLSPLGTGGLGRVWEAEDKTPGASRRPEDPAPRPARAPRKPRNASCAKPRPPRRWNIPTSFPVHDIGRLPGRRVVFQHEEGGGTFPEGTCWPGCFAATRRWRSNSVFIRLLTLFGQVCFGHRPTPTPNGVIHRGLEAGKNIMIGDYGETMVMGLGLGQGHGGTAWRDARGTGRPSGHAAGLCFRGRRRTWPRNRPAGRFT